MQKNVCCARLAIKLAYSRSDAAKPRSGSFSGTHERGGARDVAHAVDVPMAERYVGGNVSHDDSRFVARHSDD